MESWAVVQYDNRPLNKSLELLVQKNKEYCAKHNYKYIFETKEYNLPPYWIKVKLAQDLLKKYKGVFWLDSDAVIQDSVPFTALVKEGRSFYYCKDAPKFPSKFNAGVWLVLNDTIGRSLLDDWLKSYDKTKWHRFPDGKWVSSGNWSGETYEQGAFIKFIEPKYRKSLYKYNWRKFQSVEINKEAFTLHFAGEYEEENLPAYIKTLKAKPKKTRTRKSKRQ